MRVSADEEAARDVEDATRVQLSQAGVVPGGSGLAAVAVDLARRLDGEVDGRVAAALAMSYVRTMAELAKAARPATGSALDELRSRREARRKRG